MASTAVSKAAERIKETVEAGAYYEAQQMYKAAYHRHRSRKQLAESYAILKEGAVQQLKAGQVTCGMELALLLVDAFTQDNQQPVGEALQACVDIIRALPLAADSSTSAKASTDAAASTSGDGSATKDRATVLSEVTRFVSAAVKWGNKHRAVQSGVRRIHDEYAQVLWQQLGQSQLARVLMHFSRGADTDAFSQVLCDCLGRLPLQERDLFTARAVLQVLATAAPATLEQQLGHAKAVLEAMSQSELVTPPPGGSRPPLVNFLSLLLQALSKRSLPLVRLLLDRYGPLLALDPALDDLINRTEAVYLKVRAAPGGPLGGLLGNLMKSMAADLGDDEDEELPHEDEDDDDLD